MNMWFYEYAYFASSLILFIVWLPIFLKRKDLRREMIFSGVLSSLMGATDFLYIPEYWDPPFLFDLMNKIGVSIEDITLYFFMGGVMAVLYEYIIGRRLNRIKGRSRFHLGVIGIFIIFYFGLEIFFPTHTIINLSVSCTIGAILAVALRRDLAKQVISSGFLFTFLYVILFNVFLAIFPEFINNYYNYSNLLGIYYLNLPIEEFLVSFSSGMMWSILYEYTLGYKTAPFHSSNIAHSSSA